MSVLITVECADVSRGNKFILQFTKAFRITEITERILAKFFSRIHVIIRFINKRFFDRKIKMHAEEVPCNSRDKCDYFFTPIFSVTSSSFLNPLIFFKTSKNFCKSVKFNLPIKILFLLKMFNVKCLRN